MKLPLYKTATVSIPVQVAGLPWSPIVRLTIAAAAPVLVSVIVSYGTAVPTPDKPVQLKGRLNVESPASNEPMTLEGGVPPG